MENEQVSDEMPDDSSITIQTLKQTIQMLQKENQQLKQQAGSQGAISSADDRVPFPRVNELSADQVERYSRQLLISDGFGVKGQKELLSSSVLVVGAGGIGSTVLLYLASFGVGRIGVADFDVVEMSNLHRQIIHKQISVGVNKAVSACEAMYALNPTIRCIPIEAELTHDNAIEIIQSYDLVVDASDNPKTRYLINDACVILGKPLVSGSAVGTEGQLTVYNYNGGPCYRCMYPKASVSAGCKACSDAGVLGPVPGLIGILQAMETVKVLTGLKQAMDNRMLIYEALQTSFLSIKKPSKNELCPVCGSTPTIRTMDDSRANLEQTRGPLADLYLESNLPDDAQISCKEYAQIRKDGIPHVLIDVRVEQQFEMCSLDGAINIPLAQLPEQLDRVQELSMGQTTIYCMCRRGIASAEATKLILKAKEDRPNMHSVKNVTGGLTSWQSTVDTSFPKY
jgi:adenylyltransferase/sulfurtransferase